MSRRDEGSKRFELEYGTALLEFKAIRKEHTRTAFCGRNFVLVPSVTKRLHQKSPTCLYQHDLDRLRVSAYMSYWGERPYVTLERLQDYLGIFYTLLDLECPYLVHLFAHHDRKDDRLPFSKETLTLTIDRGYLESHRMQPEDFYQRFYDKQYEWCPMKFDMEMDRRYDNQVIPGYRRERIKPRRDGLTTSSTIGHSASLWSLEIPEELVGDSLRERIPNARFAARDFTREPQHHDKNLGQRYRLALKRFPRDKFHQFDIEMKMFTALTRLPGIIQYVGWYQSIERDDSNKSSEFFTIVLELAQFDLYKAFREEAPPITPDEIHGFWDAMLDVAKALQSIHHDLKIDSIDFDMWHGDIKPENILRVGDCFKLADPGEARIQVASQSQDAPTTNVPGGTRTYAAPEKSAYLDGKSKEPQPVKKSTDVWSLGCVFSVAATFVVLGKEGVQQYDRVRRHFILQKTDVIGDAFHDGTDVLGAVKDWHQYLRGAARHTDAFTSAILDVVDNHMLLPASKRWDANVLCKHLQQLLGDPDLRASALSVPLEIEDMLQKIDLHEEFRHEQSVGITRVDSDEARKCLPDDLRRDGEHMAPPKTKDELYAQRLLPTAQRTQVRVPAPHHSGERRSSDTASLMTKGSSVSRTPTVSTVLPSRTEPRRTPTNLSGATPALHDDVPNDGPAQSPARYPVTIWAVQNELEASRKSRKLSDIKLSDIAPSRLPSLFKKKEQTVRTNKYWQKMSLGKVDPLQPFLDGRDIIYLVDNGSTMYKHWSQIAHWMHILVWRSLGYDDNGMELYFTNPDTKITVPPGAQQHVDDFVKALGDARPSMPDRGSVVRTNIEPKLVDIMNKYLMERDSTTTPKKKTIIVLTDGAWQGMKHEHLVENSVKSRLEALMADQSDLAETQYSERTGSKPSPEQLRAETIRVLEDVRPVTLQFIRFGHDEKGKERLRRLDDDVKGNRENPDYPDLIDTEPADGDVYKMFTGSLSEEADQTITVVSTVPSTSLSPLSTSTECSVFGSRPRADTAASEATSMTSPMSPISSSTSQFGTGSQFWSTGSQAHAELDVFLDTPEKHQEVEGRTQQHGRHASTSTQPYIYGASAQTQGGSNATAGSARRPAQSRSPHGEFVAPRVL